MAGRKSIFRVNKDGFTQYAFLLNRGIEGVKEDIQIEHARLSKKLIAASRKHFMAHPRRDGETSWSKGGRPYRSHIRATGRFFGPVMTAFKSVNFDTGTTQGFGWPNIDFADEATDGAWRSLELGLPPSRHLMPRYIWTDGQGEPKEREEGGVIFQPTHKNLSMHGSGIDAWSFLLDGWNDVVKPGKMARTYREIARIRFKRFRK